MPADGTASDHVAARSGARSADHVELRLPADSAYLSVLRTATAGLAARLDFTLDDIEDLRIAVDEACALLLQQADTDAELLCEFDLDDDALAVRVSTPTQSARPPERGTFAWAVLAALAGEVDAGVDRAASGSRDVIWIAMHKQRGPR
jgi:serine/threonine-protein kinase RsbW